MGPGKMLESNFQLGLQYLSGPIKQLMIGKPSLILTGRWDSTGKLEAAIIKKLRDNIQLRFSAGYPQGSDL